MNAFKTSQSNMEIQPFLKWAGGKRSLLPELISRMPQEFNNYFESFIGGGALFFELKRLGLLEHKDVFLFDKNSELFSKFF
jgi:DNA adenine methylase